MLAEDGALAKPVPGVGTTSRRTFLKQLSGGVGTVLAAGGAAPAARAPFPPDRLGVALVGLGNYSTNQLAPALQETEHCYLAGIVTGTPAKAEAWMETYGLPESHVYSYETYDRLAENPDIDIVYVVLPNAMHAEYTIRAAQAGKHVLCEKPMAVSSEECEAMIAACRAAGKRLGIGYRLHFEPHNLEAMRIGQEQVFGPVKFIEAGFGFRLDDPSRWRLNKAMAGGGALVDVGIYALQATRYVTGEEPIAVTAQEIKTDPETYVDVDETLFWQFEFPSGAAATCRTSYAAYTERLYVAAERGWLELKPAYSYSGIQGRTHQGPLNFPQVNQQALHMDAFALSIQQDTPFSASGEEGLRDVRLIEAIYKAAATGQRVTLA